MLTLDTKIARGAVARGAEAGGAAPRAFDAQLVLPYELREKSRLRATLSDGRTAAVLSARGTVLRGGELLTGPQGVLVQVVAALEPIFLVRCADPRTLLVCAFHLGNRHTQAELGDGFLRIRQDPVLKDMLERLGAQVEAASAPFEPEAGAYGGHAHGAGHLLAPLPLRQKIHRPSDAA